MGESLASKAWQETVDLAVTRLEEQTGLSLAGKSPLEISLQVRAWMNARAHAKLGAHHELAPINPGGAGLDGAHS